MDVSRISMDVDSHQSPESSRLVNSRRPKIAQACEDCRSRKVRCDGGKPTCGACRRRRKAHRVPCVYLQERSSNLSAHYVAQLEQRVRQLEGGHYDQLDTALIEPQTQGSTGANSRDYHLSTSAHITSPQSHDLSYVTPYTAPRDGADAMGNFGATEITLPETSSSAAGFMTQIKNAITAKLSTSQQQRPTASMSNKDLPDPWTDPRASLLGRSTTDLFVLPARRIADEMMAVYWGQVHILYPFLMSDRFNPLYQRLFSGEVTSSSEVPTYCIMNLAFAIVCQITKKESPEDKAAAADVYYRRAALLLQTSVIGRCSLELLQALLLMGQYLQSTEWPRRCWVVIGHAIRTAQALGLHLPATTEHVPQQDRELMRRLWHGCIFFDRMVSMTLGRPTVVSQAAARDVPLPAEIDDIYLSPLPGIEGQQPENLVSTTSFFSQSLKLIDILEQILLGMYSAGSSLTSSSRSSMEKLTCLDFNTILRIDDSFKQWNDSLPTALLIEKDQVVSVSPVLSRQARVLRLRYLQNRILLFRPVVSLLLAPDVRSRALSPDVSSTEWLPLAMALPCARECVRSALETISIIHQRQNWLNERMIEPLPSWWFEVFFIYTAATALIPARVYSYVRGDIPQSELREAWQQSLEVLHHLSRLSPSAVSCIAALQVLDDELVFEGTGSHPKLPDTIPNALDHSGHGGSKRSALLEIDPKIATLPMDMGDVPSLQDTDSLDALLQMQDFTWLDTLPVDILSGGYADMPDMWQEPW